MNIVCIVFVPLFFAAMLLYCQFWMEVEDFNRVFAFFCWGLVLGVIYQIAQPCIAADFEGKIAVSAQLVKTLLIDGLLFGGVFVLSFWGLCTLFLPDNMHNKASSSVDCFGLLCGVLTVENILVFVRDDYVTSLAHYIPYGARIIGVSAVCGLFFGMFRDAQSVLQKILFLLCGIVSCALLCWLYGFAAFYKSFWQWGVAAVCVGAAVVMYMMDYNAYSGE